MNEKIGKLSAHWVWLFALAAVVVGVGAAYATAGLGSKVSSAVYFGVFLTSGFAATALTKAKALLSLSAFLLASLLSAASYYVVTMQAVAETTSALGAAEAGGALGAAIGIFVAVITFFVSAAGGVGGALAGLRARKQLAAA
ncbi:MAG: hypothetical protein KF729_31200 [Sandaracinaceae bacterium]|nr:hypothetical protein [Sandaracinaceae bacterium]